MCLTLNAMPLSPPPPSLPRPAFGEGPPGGSPEPPCLSRHSLPRDESSSYLSSGHQGKWPLAGPCSWDGCPISTKASVLVSLSVNELYVDDPDKDSGGKIDVSLNISLPNLHCECEYSRQPSAPARPLC